MRSIVSLTAATALCVVALTTGSAVAQSDGARETVRPLGDGRVEVPSRSEQYLTIEEVGAEVPRLTIRAPARVTFREGAVVRMNSTVGGRITTVHAGLGDKVSEGDPLVTIDSPEAAQIRSELEQARVELRSARAEFERQEEMAERGIGTERERFRAETALSEAQTGFARAQMAAEFLGEGEGRTSTLIAPRDGTILSRDASAGALTEGNGEALMVIGDREDLWVIAEVFERDLGMVEPGAEVEIELGREAPVSGRVVRIGSVIDEGRRRAPVYIELDDPVAGMRPGMFARAGIRLDLQEGVTLPPAAVLILDDDRHVVFVREGDGIYAPREVTIGPTLDGRIQVLSGVEAGDEAVVRGGLLLERAANQML